MRSFVLSLAATLIFSGAAVAQTTSARSNLPEVLRGTSAEPTTKKPAKSAVHKASVAHSVQQRPPAKRVTTPQSLRASRYGGFAPAPPLPPPVLDTTSPRS